MSKELKFFMSTEGENGKEVQFELDENNNLYIDKKQVVTREIVQLRWIELFALLATAAGVITQAIFAVLTYIRL